MTLETTSHPDFPFYTEAREALSDKYSLQDVFTEDILEVSLERVLSTISREDTTKQYGSENQFKTFIGAKTLLSEINNPLYAYMFFKGDAERIISEYSIPEISIATSIPVTKVSGVDSEVLLESEFSDAFSDATVEQLSKMGDKYFDTRQVSRFGDSVPIYSRPELEHYIEDSDEDSLSDIIETFYRGHNSGTTFYKLPISVFQEYNASERNINEYRITDGNVYLNPSEAEEVYTEILIDCMTEKYPTPKPKEFGELIESKAQTLEAQIKIDFSVSSEQSILVECLPPQLQSIILRCDSAPETISTEEFKLLFLTLSRVGFTPEEIADFIPFNTDIGENYTYDLISDASLSRREPVPDWEEVEETCSGLHQSNSIYNITSNPVEYYNLYRAVMEMGDS